MTDATKYMTALNTSNIDAAAPRLDSGIVDAVRQTIADEWGSHVCYTSGDGFDRNCDKDKRCRCADIARAVVSQHPGVAQEPQEIEKLHQELNFAFNRIADKDVVISRLSCELAQEPMEPVAWQYKHESNGDDGWYMLARGADPTEFLKQWPGIKYDVRPLYAAPQPASNAYEPKEPVAFINRRLEDLAEANALYGKDQRLNAPDKIARNDREISWLKDLRSMLASPVSSTSHSPERARGASSSDGSSRAPTASSTLPRGGA